VRGQQSYSYRLAGGFFPDVGPSDQCLPAMSSRACLPDSPNTFRTATQGRRRGRPSLPHRTARKPVDNNRQILIISITVSEIRSAHATAGVSSVNALCCYLYLQQVYSFSKLWPSGNLSVLTSPLSFFAHP
jgi:hypothetical protein